jgi:hypothetical protein
MKEQNCLEIEYEGEEINKRRNRSFNGNLNRTSYEPQSKKTQNQLMMQLNISAHSPFTFLA